MSMLMLLNAAPVEETVSNTTACLIGVGTVFVGLVCIIILCKIIGAFFTMSEKKETATKEDVAVSGSNAAAPVEIPNRGETVAAIATAIAEATGTDISAIRILSIEKM